MRHAGVDLDSQTLMLLGAGATDDQISGGAVGLASISMAPEALAEIGAVLAERDAPRGTIAFQPETEAFSRLKVFHKPVTRLAQRRPDALAHPEVARAFDNAMSSAMVHALAEGRPSDIPRSTQRRRVVVRALDDYLQRHPGRPVYVAELCLALQLPLRSLERACHEVVGMGPRRYLWLRRLNLARRSLMEAVPSETTVAHIALAHGFSELGRFAVCYREVFGESPSATLRKPR